MSIWSKLALIKAKGGSSKSTLEARILSCDQNKLYSRIVNLLDSLYKKEQRLSEVDSFRELVRESEKLNKILEDISEQLRMRVKL